jgi:hypothetical protein
MSYEDACNVRMLNSASSLLLSIEASRPAFMMVSGLFLLVVAWRLVQGRSGWSSRLILSGALLLAFGYSVLVPLYQAGMIETFRPGRHIHGDPTVVLGWHVVKTVRDERRLVPVRSRSCPPCPGVCCSPCSIPHSPR